MKKEKLISYHGDPKIKEKAISEMKRHQAMDNLIRGTYFDPEQHKGCAVTCTMYSPDEFLLDINTHDVHARYETKLGIPRIIAALEDLIFEKLPLKEAKKFPLMFLEAIPVGVSLENVWKHFMAWLLTDPKDGVIRFAKTDLQKAAINNISAAFSKSIKNADSVTSTEWKILRAAAAAAYDADAAAAAYAAAAAAAAAYDAAAAADAAAVLMLLMLMLLLLLLLLLMLLMMLLLLMLLMMLMLLMLLMMLMLLMLLMLLAKAILLKCAIS